MLALMCILAAVVAAAALFIETVVGWFVFFSPGWANGWPTPWSFQIVLSIGLTSQTLVMLMTAALGFGAILGFICTLLGIRWERVGRGYRVWFWFVLAFLCLGACIFWHNYAWVCEQFPDGYIIT